MILQELQMPLMVYLYIYNKKDDDTSKEIQEDACKAASCKNNTRCLHGE
jgi:hypothetical protein